MAGLIAPVLIVLAALVVASPAGAQSRLNRCLDEAGHSVFTDLRCEDLGAAPYPSRDGAHERFATMPHGCAIDRRELQRRLQHALDRSDPNALAASYHWPGIGRRQALSVMRRLERLAEEAAVAQIEPGAAEDVQFLLRGNDHPEPARFALARHAGCWWIVD